MVPVHAIGATLKKRITKMMVRMAVRRDVLVLLVPRLPLFDFARRLVSCLREARAEAEGPTGSESLVEPESTACAEAPTDVE